MKSKKFSLIISKPIKILKKIIVDSDKSLSIRSFNRFNLSESFHSRKYFRVLEDVHSTINCLKNLGIKIKKSEKIYKIFEKELVLFKLKIEIN